jgi:hypothetical protein
VTDWERFNKGMTVIVAQTFKALGWTKGIPTFKGLDPATQKRINAFCENGLKAANLFPPKKPERKA